MTVRSIRSRTESGTGPYKLALRRGMERRQEPRTPKRSRSLPWRQRCWHLSFTDANLRETSAHSTCHHEEYQLSKLDHPQNIHIRRISSLPVPVLVSVRLMYAFLRSSPAPRTAPNLNVLLIYSAHFRIIHPVLAKNGRWFLPRHVV